MKLKNIFPQRRRRVVRQFGNASLIRHRDGRHELIGGTDADRTAAFEWVSLFAHEIVFAHFYRETGNCHRPRKSLVAPRLQPSI